MRRVTFKNPHYKVGQTPVMIEGFFHGFFSSALESRDGNITFTVALVEDDLGRMHELGPTGIQFLTPQQIVDEKK